MGAATPTLTEACGNVLLWLTAFRRNSATSKLAPKELQEALERELDAARERCEADLRLRPLFERVHYPLVAMIDQAVLTSAWPHKAVWQVNLLETRRFRTAEAGKRFYSVVEEVLADPRDEAREVAELLFTCMGLGFQGRLIGERKEFERQRRLLFDKARLPPLASEPIAPECYGRNLVRPVARLPTVGVVRMALVAAGVLLLALLAVWITTGRCQEYVADVERAIARAREPR